MKTMLATVTAFGMLANAAAAETRYDRRLEAAVMERVAARIGRIRGGFEFGKTAVFVRLRDAMTTGPVQAKAAASVGSALRGTVPLTSAGEARPSRVVF